MNKTLIVAFVVLVILFISIPFIGFSQKSKPRNSGYAKTAVVPKKQKAYKYIIIADTKDVLYGNKCAVQATHRFGFEYLPMPKSQMVAERESSVMFHNLFTGLGISLRHGFWWKLLLKKRINECQTKGHDMNSL